MAAPAAQPLVNPKKEKMLPAQWIDRDTNWMITSAGNCAQCLDANYGNVAVFAKKCFDPTKETSFLMIIKIKNGGLSQARLGLVAPDYSKIENKDLRRHDEYSWYSSSGNSLLGSVSTTFNFAIDLKKQVQMNTRTVQLADENVRDTFDGEIEMRINIRNNLVEFHCPTLWRNTDEKVVYSISHPGQLRLAVCSPAGFGFDLQEILPRLTLKDEIPMGLDLSVQNLDDMADIARARCNEIVDQTRRTSPEDGERYNLLVAGAFGSGKSSLINTFISLFSNFDSRPKQPALISQNTTHTTRRVSSYQLPGTNIYLVDSIGLAMTGNRLNHSDGLLEELFRGNIHAGFDIRNLDQISGPRVRMERGVPVLIQENEDEAKQQIDVRGYTTADLQLDRRNHGAFVTRAAPQFGDNLAETFQIVLDFSGDHDNYPLVGVVTKLDVGKKDFSVPKIFTEPDICEEYDSIRKEMRLPSVFPARPYTAEDQHRQNAFYNLLVADLMDKMMGEAVEYKERLREYYTDTDGPYDEV